MWILNIHSQIVQFKDLMYEALTIEESWDRDEDMK